MSAVDCGTFGLASFDPVVASEARTDVAGEAEEAIMRGETAWME
jgi:hypothetical protein